MENKEVKRSPRKPYVKVPMTEYRKCKRRERQFLEIKLHISAVSNIIKQMR
jgi:hypothetical protein